MSFYIFERKKNFDRTVLINAINDKDLTDDLWNSIQKCVCSPSRIAECVDIEATKYANKQKERNDKKAQDFENELRAKYSQASEIDESIFDEFIQETPVTGDSTSTTTEFTV